MLCRAVDWEEVESLQDVAADVDVLYQTRIQKERFQDRPEDYEKARGKYIIDSNIMKILRKDSVIMHPLPRVDEVRLLGTTPDLKGTVCRSTVSRLLRFHTVSRNVRLQYVYSAAVSLSSHMARALRHQGWCPVTC